MENMKKILNKSISPKDLKYSYMDACSDKEFKTYLECLNIEDDILMKYTSSLEEAFKEYSSCEKCKGLEYCPNVTKGFAYTPEKQNRNLLFSYIACSKYKEKLESDKYKKNIYLFDIPKEITKASFKNIYKDDKKRVPIIKYFKEFINDFTNDKSPKGLYLNGSFGSGKTYLIAALFNELAKKDVKSAIVYYPEFLRNLKASFSNNYEEKFEYIKKVQLLLLDDIGAENCSSWSRDEVLGPILQYRMDEGLATFFTSNLTLKELEVNLSMTAKGVDKVKARRIIERIKQLTNELELISINRRN